jgi:hypothetical protein
VRTPLGNSNFLKEIKALLEVAGLPPIRFHDLRHTTGSLPLNREKPIFVVSKILGQSKPSTSMDVSGHLIPYIQDGFGGQIDEWLTPIPIQKGENCGWSTSVNHCALPNCSKSALNLLHFSLKNAKAPRIWGLCLE